MKRSIQEKSDGREKTLVRRVATGPQIVLSITLDRSSLRCNLDLHDVCYNSRLGCFWIRCLTESANDYSLPKQSSASLVAVIVRVVAPGCDPFLNVSCLEYLPHIGAIAPMGSKTSMGVRLSIQIILFRVCHSTPARLARWGCDIRSKSSLSRFSRTPVRYLRWSANPPMGAMTRMTTVLFSGTPSVTPCCLQHNRLARERFRVDHTLRLEVTRSASCCRPLSSRSIGRISPHN